jgi:hypothetical protein
MSDEYACVSIDPGICGFPCHIYAHRRDRYSVRIEITESGCGQVQRLAAQLNDLSLRDVTAPVTRNPVYQTAQSCGCHPSCVLPAAVIKAAEAAMQLALPKEVRIRFGPCRETP